MLNDCFNPYFFNLTLLFKFIVVLLSYLNPILLLLLLWKLRGDQPFELEDHNDILPKLI